MKYRQKALLYLVEVLQERSRKPTKTLLDKLLFVAAKETSLREKPFYNFYPYRFGPFSSAFYADLTQLESNGDLRGLHVTPKGVHAAGGLRKKDQHAIQELAARFQTAKEVIDYVYANYTEYAVRSELIAHPLEPVEPGIFSIGYQGKDLDSFLDALIQNNIQEVVDVRANPFSMNFTFVKSVLAAKLEKAGIAYRHVPELGIDGALRREHLAENDYETLFKTYAAKILPSAEKQVQELVTLGQKKRIALLCFEKNVNCCHRGVLSQRIEKRTGKRVEHL